MNCEMRYIFRASRTLHFFIVIQACLLGSWAEVTYEEEEELRSALQTGYRSDVRPSSPTLVKVIYTLRTLQYLDTATETIATTGWMTLAWHDPRLVWTPTEYANITVLDLKWAWNPTFAVTNVIEKFTFFGELATTVRAFHTGYVRWDQPLIVTTTCSVDITLFPFDSQTCYLEGLFWTNNIEEVFVMVEDIEVQPATYVPNGEWRLVDADSGEDGWAFLCCPLDLVSKFNYTLTFERKRPYYVMNLLLPTLMMSICIVWTFILPIESGERISYAITIMLTYTVLLTMTTELLPSTSTQTPYIASYIMLILVFSLIAVALTVLSVTLFHMKGRPPNAICVFCHCLRRALFCGCHCRNPTKDRVSPTTADLHLVDGIQFPANQSPARQQGREATMDTDVFNDTKEQQSVTTWRQVSAILDRLFFCMFFAGIAVLNILTIAALNGLQISPITFGTTVN